MDAELSKIIRTFFSFSDVLVEIVFVCFGFLSFFLSSYVLV